MTSRGHGRCVSTVAVTGISGALGRVVAGRLASDEAVERIIGVDLVDPGDLPERVEMHRLDLASADLKAVLEGVDTVIHLAFDHTDDEQVARQNVEGARRLLDAAGAVGAGSVVLLSSATAYGAWPQNPLPLTEDAPLRPNPGFTFAIEKAEIERHAWEWADDHPDVAVSALRPAMAVSDRGATWLSRVLWAASLLHRDDDAPPQQFVHLDDLASAAVLAADRRLEGPFNVAPDGWMEAEEVRALTGARPRVPLPTRAWRRVTGLGRGLGLTDLPAGVEPLLEHRWVVASDRLRAEGWAPVHSNEQAFVAAFEGSPWTEMSPKRRQELALGVMAAAIAGASVAGATAWRRWQRSG